MPENLPDHPVLLKQLLEQMINQRASDKGKIVHLEDEMALLRQRLFGPKNEQAYDTDCWQHGHVNTESVPSSA